MEIRNQKPETRTKTEARTSKPKRCFRFSLFGFLSGFWFLVSGFSFAEPTTAPKTPEGAFEVTDWVIFVCDPNQPQANASSLFNSTLPDFMGSRRSPAPVEKES